jgi:hypothetical protein
MSWSFGVFAAAGSAQASVAAAADTTRNFPMLVRIPGSPPADVLFICLYDNQTIMGRQARSVGNTS